MSKLDRLARRHGTGRWRALASEAFVRARLQCTNDVEGAGVEVQVQHVERMSPQLFLDLF